MRNLFRKFLPLRFSTAAQVIAHHIQSLQSCVRIGSHASRNQQERETTSQCYTVAASEHRFIVIRIGQKERKRRSNGLAKMVWLLKPGSTYESACVLECGAAAAW